MVSFETIIWALDASMLTITLFVAWKLYVFLSWPLNLNVFEKRAGNSIFQFPDRARKFKTPEGYYQLQIRGLRKKTKPISLDYVFMSKWGQSAINLFRLHDDLFIPLKPSFATEDVGFNLADYDTSLLYEELENKKAASKYNVKSPLDLWMPILNIAAVGILSLLIIKIALDNVAISASNAASVASSTLQFADKLERVLLECAGNKNAVDYVTTTADPGSG